MAVNYLQVDGVSKLFGDRLLFSDVSFGVAEGDKVAIIARNGAGKSTLLSIITGNDFADEGTISLLNDISVGMLPQEPHFPEDMSVMDACFSSGNSISSIIAEYESIITSGGAANELADIMARMDRLQAWDYEARVKQILGRLKITNMEQKIRHLSYGQLKRVALANVLISEPDFLILDEPTNHLDMDMVEWLEDYLSRSKIALLMVTHDRYFLDRVCNVILEIDNKRMYSYKGNFSYYLEKRQARIDTQNAELAHANNLFRKELDWMRRQPQARAGKAKARIDSFYELEEKVRTRREEQDIKLEVKATYLGTKIFVAKDVCKAFDGLKILNNFSYSFNRYEKMGIVGNNGTGKSTFIKILVGVEKPDHGSIDIGETVSFGYYTQEGLVFDENAKVIDVIRDIAEYVTLGDGRKMSASQFLQHFLFTPETQYSFIQKLSGGERRRLHLCSVLMRNPNFLILDEPTNDLDIMTLSILEDYLISFKGCVIVVSHDRYFMDKVVDHILVFKGNAEIKDFPGNYSLYREWSEIQEDKTNKAKVVKKTEKQRDNSTVNKEKPRKLTYKEQRELEQLEVEIELLEKEKRELEISLSSGTLQGDELFEKSTRIGTVNEEIENKTLRWMELSDVG